MPKSIIVIGAGAAGLTAAISAARAGANVTILEAQERPGRKLLVTGNGRCNLTNRAASAHYEALFQEQPVYHGTGAALAQKLISFFDANETISFFRSIGLLTIEKNECIYPYSMQASSVLDVLLAECRRLHVKLKFSQKILRIDESSDPDIDTEQEHTKNENIGNAQIQAKATAASVHRFSVVTSGWTYQADSIILACGSPAAPATGASEACYQPAKMLDHTIIDPQPALAPLTCCSVFLNQLAGVRCRAEVTLLRLCNNHSQEKAGTKRGAQCFRTDTEILAKDIGELQWTKYGVSGIVIFQLSRFLQNTDNLTQKQLKGNHARSNAVREDGTPASDNYELRINFLPDYTIDVLEMLLWGRANDLAEESTSVLLRGILNEKLISPVLDVAFTGTGYFPKVCAKLSKQDCARICQTIMDFRLPVTGTKSFDMAQVCAGGVDCREITDTLESRLHQGLYFAGEMLDIDGPCGGFNLQWAWTSGYLAGAAAAGRPWEEAKVL